MERDIQPNEKKDCDGSDVWEQRVMQAVAVH